MKSEKVAVIETNLGYVGRRLMEEGALDYSIFQGIGKKGRPAFIAKVVARPKEAERLAKLLMRESGTGGVRITEARMLSAERKYEMKGKVTVKRFFLDGKEISSKAESDTAEAEARKTGKTLREVRKDSLI
jgi:uncharacterized protein (DUF111 family)